MKMKVRVNREPRAFLSAFMAAEEPIAQAATAALGEAGERIKAAARADISAAGFSAKWQNALRVDRYPRGREVSINAAAHVYHRIPYASVHEEGATIYGSPLLWLPLSHAPAKIGRFRMTPRRYPGTLQFARRAGKPPLPVARLGISRGRAKKGLGRITLAAARKGTDGGGKNRVVRSVPMFVGISTVRLRKRFGILAIVRREAARLAELYRKHLEASER